MVALSFFGSRFHTREMRRPAFEYLADALMQEENQRSSYYMLTDVLMDGESIFDQRCSLYDRLARINGFMTLDEHRLLRDAINE